MSKMYNLHNKFNIVKGKKNIFVFLLDATLKKNIYITTYKYLFNLIKILKQDFNIIIISKNSGETWLKYYKDHEEFGEYSYLTFDKEKKYGSTNSKQMSHQQRVEYIIETFKELEQNEKELFDNFAGVVCSQFIIPSLNTNYEIISEDETLVNKRQHSINLFMNNIENHKLISHCAFIHKPLGFPVEFLMYLMKNYPNKGYYGFCHDTGSTWLLFNKKYNPFTKNVECYYFIDDERGIRDFKQFPMTQLHDFFNKSYKDKSYYDNIANNKTKDFIFGGLFPFQVDYRINAWYRFFDKLNVNGIIRTQVDGKPIINENGLKLTKLPKKFNNDEVKKIINDILKNPLVTNTIPYDQYNDQLKDSLFTIVLKCYYGKYDSLNFRIINSLYFGTIPLIDSEYDIDNLQVPEYFKNKLIVYNNNDIEDKVNYYKNNIDEYKKLFFELFDYFIDKKYFDLNYYNNEFKKDYFDKFYK